MDYTTLTLAETQAQLEGIARDAQEMFGALTPRQLNWRPDEQRWGVAQCLDHLLTANQLMVEKARAALVPDAPRTIWQRLPVLPGMLGKVMVRSLTPDSTRKFTAPPASRPVFADLPADVVQRFAEQQRETARWLGTIAAGRAESTIMASPFLRVITYSVLDAARLIVAHDRRHMAQARRVMAMPQFPGPA